DQLYVECVTIMRNMFRKCRLVHAGISFIAFLLKAKFSDLSEFNILFYDNHLIIIDVSQSVEHDHPYALTFLRSDIGNVTKFFMERGAKVFGMKRLFEIIVDPLIDESKFAEALINERSCDNLPDDSFFMNAYIPHKLEQIVTFERDHLMEKQGHEPNNPFQKVIGKTLDNEEKNVEELERLSTSKEENGSTTDEPSDEDSGEHENDEENSIENFDKQDKKVIHQRHPRLKGESNEARKARKEAVKEEKRDQRKNKVPKKFVFLIMAQPENNLMNMSMTRSIYIAIDKTAEVLKRKEAAEKELLARREAKMKEQAERLERARNQKETELRERIRERQQREMERQKAALDRRCAQLDKLNAKKEEILQKNHQKTSRVAVGRQQNKPVFVFGSSTPRELCFLEKGGQQKRSNQALSTNSRGSASPQQNLRSEPPTARVPSRFTTSHYRGEKPIPSSNVMTRSVFGSLTSSTSANNNKQPTSPRRKPSAVKKQTRSPLSSTTSTRSAPQPLMTQSLYSSKPLQNGSPKSAPSKAKTPENVSKKNAIFDFSDIDPRQQRRPVIRRKVEDKAKVLKSPVAGTSATISTHFQQPTIDFNMTMEKTFEEDIIVQNQNVVPAFE
uniref:non-specific serine/threonine protein kinase n=1 Tax=Meloidogyne javanica TaxID=6303 RepID=A0A915MS57_MELJA